jgi:TolB-like protein
VLQWSLAYLAAALALAHGQELLSHAFHWPEIIGRLVVGALVVGFPVAVALAWYHGHKGLRRISPGEMTIVSILLVIGAGLLIALVRAPQEPAPLQAQAPPPIAAERALSSGATSQAGIAPAQAGAPAKPRLAILPFENLSPDPANAFFADGLQEDVISTLASRAPNLEVISRTTMMLYRAAPKPIIEVAKELGATHVIEGSLRRQGNHVRLTLQLIDGATDNHLWAQTYDRTLKDALTLQADVAREVASQLAVQLTGGGRPAGAPTTVPEAYDSYLKSRIARQELNPNSPTLMPDIGRISTLLEDAVKRDPKFGLARLELANHLVQLFTIDGNPAQLREARMQLDAAQRIIPSDPVLTVTRAYYDYLTSAVPRWDPAVADALMGPAQDTLNLQVGQALLDAAGRFNDSLQLFARWARLDPANLLVFDIYAWELAAQRRTQEALSVLNVMTSRPGGETFAISHARLAFAYTGHTEELRQALDRVGSRLSEDYRLGFAFDALRFEHRYADLLQVLTQTRARSILLPDSFALITASPIPVTELRGWAALLAGDAGAAERAGQTLVTDTKDLGASAISLWYVSSLRAEAQLLAGRKAAAIAEARHALAIRPREHDALTWRELALRSARVLAWAGAKDEAVELLEGLATGENGLGPAEITRDPLFDVPLADNPRYQALRAKLEAQIRAADLQYPKAG